MLKHKISISKIFQRLLIGFLYFSRTQLGFWNASVCIFEESCTRFAERQLKERAIIIAIPIIISRVLLCNPLTGIFFWLTAKRTKKTTQ